MSELRIADGAADVLFSQLLRRVCPDSYEFEYKYVDHEASRIRHVFQPTVCDVAERRVLEFGCNIGATAIVLAHLGGRIAACDVSKDFLELAQLNARRYGVANAIQFIRIQEGASLPFADSSFDLITCNSVLEYVEPSHLPGIQRELNRVLRPGGLLVVFGTSNRLWPIEAHSRQWLVNYLPSAFDRFHSKPVRRGLWPWQLRWGFGKYVDVLERAGPQMYMNLRDASYDSSGKRRAVRLVASICRVFKVSPGLVMPYVFVVLLKPVRS